jgi:hypothetical protein
LHPHPDPPPSRGREKAKKTYESYIWDATLAIQAMGEGCRGRFKTCPYKTFYFGGWAISSVNV